MDFQAMIAAAVDENDAAGIDMRGGKKYTSVARRVGIFRSFAGADLGCETEIVHYGTAAGEPVVVKATVRRADGTIVATGIAEEIRGAGNVNKTSALENAETSAIGRALANLGLSGGEFASVNEIDAVDRKKTAQTEAAARAEKLFEEEVAAKVKFLDEMADEATLRGFWGELNEHNRAIAADPRVVAAKDNAKARLSEEKEAA